MVLACLGQLNFVLFASVLLSARDNLLPRAEVEARLRGQQGWAYSFHSLGYSLVKLHLVE